MSKIFQGKKILVVGGSSGIGYAVAVAAAQKGAELIIASRTARSQHEILASELGENIITCDLDITSKLDIAELFLQIESINHLVVSVRPDTVPTLFSETGIDSAKKAFDVKFWGQYQLIQLALPKINENGSIILTSGIAGAKIYPKSLTMSLINSATETFVKSLAVEIAPIRVNAVSPGFVSPKPTTVKDYAKTFPQQRLANVNEIANAYIYLLENSYITGTTITVDGGATLV